jgi:hypothetical protein
MSLSLLGSLCLHWAIHQILLPVFKKQSPQHIFIETNTVLPKILFTKHALNLFQFEEKSQLPAQEYPLVGYFETILETDLKGHFHQIF